MNISRSVSRIGCAWTIVWHWVVFCEFSCLRCAFAWEENVANRCQQHVLSLSQTPQIKPLRSDKSLYQQAFSDSLWTVNKILWYFMGICQGCLVQHVFTSIFYTYIHTHHIQYMLFFNDISMLYIFVVIERAAFYVSILPFFWGTMHLEPFFGKLPYSHFLQIFRMPRWYGTWTGSFGRCLFLGSLEYYTIIPANGRWWWRDGSRGGGFGFCCGWRPGLFSETWWLHDCLLQDGLQRFA